MNILIAEDDPISATVLKRALTCLDHEVTIARNGAEALDLLVERSFGVVIADWMMPELDGIELCRRLRAAPHRTYTYFIVISSKEAPGLREQVLEAGADDFLVKSLDPAELFERIAVAERFAHAQERLIDTSENLMERQKELASINVNLCEQINIDSLTGLKNHRAFFEGLERCYSFAVRQNTPLSVVLADVDYFKNYNDTHGHLAGDDVLRSVAKILRMSARSHDLVARYGGEEFAIILPMTDVHSAMIMAERVRKQIASHSWGLRSITASFGISGYTSATKSVSELVHQADRALYHSKHSGRDCCSIFDAVEMSGEAPTLTVLSEIDLKEAA